MTREEKIEILEKEKAYMIAHGGDRQAEALTSAIKALEQEPSSDAIRRQAVLETLDDMDNALDEDRTVENYKELLKECYEVLPSVNPQEPETEIEELDFVQEHKKIPVTLQVQKYCDRNICVSNEYNGINCGECEVTKSQNQQESEDRKMTKEEAKDVFLNRGYVKVNGGEVFNGDKWRQSVVVISEWLKEQKSCDDMGEVSDGYHTFNQLYHQRAVLFATIVNQNKDKSWKSFKHSDGNYCFDSNGEWFIVGIDTPQGNYTYHYAKEYWDMFDCEELECGKEWDGHTEEDVTRLLSLEQEPKTGRWIQTNESFINQDGQFIYNFICSECKSLSYFRKSNKKAIGANVCPNCGARMFEQESEG